MKRITLLVIAFVIAGCGMYELYAQTTGSIFPPRFPSVGIGATAVPQISLLKTSNAGTYNTLGQLVVYTFKITNSGNVGITEPLTVNDSVQGSITPCGPSSGTLAVNASVTCTSNHPVIQNDLDNGSIVNVATATNGSVTSNPSTVTMTAVQTPALLITKVPNPTAFTMAGTVITYTYTVENTGNVTLQGNVSISDSLTGSIPQCQVGGSFPPTMDKVCTSQYTTTNTDVTNGSVTNTASAAAVYKGNPVNSNTVSATVTVGGVPFLVTDGRYNGYNDPHGSYTGVCGIGGSNADDAPPIQNTINYAGNQYNITGQPQTVLVPNAAICQMNSFPNQQSPPSYCEYSRLPSGVTLTGPTSGTPAQINSNVTSFGNCNGFRYMVGFCGAGCNNIYALMFPVSAYKPINATQFNSPNVTLKNSTDMTGFHVGDFVAMWEDQPTLTNQQPLKCSDAGASCQEVESWILTCGTAVTGATCTSSTFVLHDAIGPLLGSNPPAQAVIANVTSQTVHDAGVQYLTYNAVSSTGNIGIWVMSDNPRTLIDHVTWNNIINAGATSLLNCNEVYSTTWSNSTVNWAAANNASTEFCQRSTSRLTVSHVQILNTNTAANLNYEFASEEYPSYQSWDHVTINICNGPQLPTMPFQNIGCYALAGVGESITNSTVTGINMASEYLIADSEDPNCIIGDGFSGMEPVGGGRCQPLTFTGNILNGQWNPGWAPDYACSIIGLWLWHSSGPQAGYTITNNGFHMQPGRTCDAIGIGAGWGGPSGGGTDFYTITGNTNGGNSGDIAGIAMLINPAGGLNTTCTVSNNTGFTYNIPSSCTHNSNTFLINPYRKPLFEVATILLTVLGAFVLIRRRGRI